MNGALRSALAFFSNIGRASLRKPGPKLAHRTVRAPVASSRSAVPFLALRRSFLPCSASPIPYVRESLGRLGILKIHLLQTLLQRRFWWVRAVIEGDSALDTKFISKELIISQRLNDQFDKIIHCVPLKISKGRFRINRRTLDIRNDISCLSIRWEERARGKGIGAVEFPLDLIYRLTLIFVEVPIRRSPLKNITSTNFTTLLHYDRAVYINIIYIQPLYFFLSAFLILITTTIWYNLPDMPRYTVYALSRPKSAAEKLIPRGFPCNISLRLDFRCTFSCRTPLHPKPSKRCTL